MQQKKQRNSTNVIIFNLLDVKIVFKTAFGI
jgi:hypothetical protein